MNGDQSKEMLGTILGSVGAASFVGVVLQTIVLSAIGAIVGGVVGFLINRYLKRLFAKIDGKQEEDKPSPTKE